MPGQIYSDGKLEEIQKETNLVLIDPGRWQKYVDKKMSEPYGTEIIDFTLTWAKAIQYAVEVDECVLTEVALPLAYDAGCSETTFTTMTSLAVGILKYVWYYGDILYDWHSSL